MSEPMLNRRSALVQIGGTALSSIVGVVPANAWGADVQVWDRPRSVRVQVPGQSVREFVYWRDGQYQMDDYLALSKLCLDRRAGQAVQMDPGVFDLMFATQTWLFQALGRQSHHMITSAYRTSHTNRVVGGAPGSQHLAGKALDGHLVGVDLSTYARMLMHFNAGGVGLYARHVHWDVGRAPTFWQGKNIET